MVAPCTASNTIRSPPLIPNIDFTFVLFSKVVEVFQKLGVGLDTINFPRLQASPTKPRQVATSTVLLAQQRVDAALAPLGGSPGVTTR